MSTLGDLLAEHTVLPGSAVDHLHAVVGEWQLLADLSFADYLLWERRARPWHDWTVILLLLPVILAAVWIAVGGLVTGVERSDEARLLLEVGPGVALTGLLCTLISYHGRHHPGLGG